MKKAAYVGRFNPIHKGHARVIREMLGQYGPENSLLVIGSSNAPFSLRHFFSYDERKRFIQKLFPDARIVGLPDYNDDKVWLSALDDLLLAWGADPKEVTFFGGCQEDIRFFVDDGRRCSILNRFDHDAVKVSATEVRDALIMGRPAEHLIEAEMLADLQSLFREKWEKFKNI